MIGVVIVNCINDADDWLMLSVVRSCTGAGRASDGRTVCPDSQRHL